MLDPRRFIRAKRDGRSHTADEIREFVQGFLRGEVADYQVSAWLMAAFLNGLDATETHALTAALMRSGKTFDWTDLGRPTADKHSTGGVGDKVSLILAPLVAVCGVNVPMVSGRGLGHTGGTLDKLESIPGFRTQLSPEELRGQMKSIGVVMVGQGPDLAPADGMLYALRDVTATVEYEPFIVSSIVSKKVAEGAGAVVYDVKCGSGAFMKSAESARRLAESLVQATRAQGRQAAALVTDMSQPLGEAVGNALEVREAIRVLRGGGPDDVRDLTLELAAWMLTCSGAYREIDAARARAQEALKVGAAWKRFLALVKAQGGNPQVFAEESGLPRAPHRIPIVASATGFIVEVDTFALGELVVALGGGRRRREQEIDPAVGLQIQSRIGQAVKKGDVLGEVHCATKDDEFAQRAAACFHIDTREVMPPPLILDRVS